MTERTRTTLIVVLVAMIAGVMALIVSLPALGTQYEDGNNYNEECESYRNHSGYISSYYDYAVFFEQGYEPIELATNGQPIFLEPPDGVAWDRVYKCKDTDDTTTTTFVETTTTTVADTTTSVGDTTTTVADTTTTVADSTTTTDPGDSTLPFTGVEDMDILILPGVLALGAGAALVWTSMRRRDER